MFRSSAELAAGGSGRLSLNPALVFGTIVNLACALSLQAKWFSSAFFPSWSRCGQTGWTFSKHTRDLDTQFPLRQVQTGTPSFLRQGCRLTPRLVIVLNVVTIHCLFLKERWLNQASCGPVESAPNSHGISVWWWSRWLVVLFYSHGLSSLKQSVVAWTDQHSLWFDGLKVEVLVLSVGCCWWKADGLAVRGQGAAQSVLQI